MNKTGLEILALEESILWQTMNIGGKGYCMSRGLALGEINQSKGFSSGSVEQAVILNKWAREASWERRNMDFEVADAISTGVSVSSLSPHQKSLKRNFQPFNILSHGKHQESRKVQEAKGLAWPPNQAKMKR